MAEPKLTFDQALQNKDLIDSMYYSLQGLGEENLEYDPETILNTFLTKKRYGDVNIFSTVGQLQDVKGMDQNTKDMFAYSLQEAEKLPSIFDEGGASSGKAVADYLLAGISDPTNLLSAIAGAFTLGSGGAAILGAKEAAKAGFKQLLNAKARAAISKPVLKSLAVEGTVAGAGGAAQAKVKQDIEQEVGLRKEGDYDVSSIALQGLLEGTISPVAGMLGNVAGSSLAYGGKKAFNSIPNSEAGATLIKKYFLPTAGISDVTRRLSERRIGKVSSIKEQAQELGEQFSSLSNRVFSDLPEQDKTKILNDLLENKPEARAEVAARSPELIELVDKFYAVKKEAYDLGKESLLSDKTRGVFEKDNANYIRNVSEAYVATRRKPFNKFLKENDNILNDYKDDIIQNVRTSSDVADRASQDALNAGSTMKEAIAIGQKAGKESINPAYLGVAQKFMSKNELTGNWDIILPDDQVNKIIKQEAKKLYTPSVLKRKETGPFKARQQVPEVVKTLIGYNNKPALRIAETVNGIVDTASKTSLAGDVIGDAARLRLGGIFKDQATAAKELGSDVTRLTGAKDSPFNLPEQYIDDSLKNAWVEKQYASQLKELFEDAPFLAGKLQESAPLLASGYRNVLAGQNFAKAGKTVYSPIAHIRNAIGAAGYVWASGNPRGIYEAVKTWKFLPKEQRAASWKEFEDLGLKGSNIDLNQVLRRFGDITSSADSPNAWQSALYLGKTGKSARKVYQATDDLGKFSAYLNEKRVANKVFDNLTPDQQQSKLARFAEEYQIDPSVVTKADYIKEVAAKNTANITPLYGRISPIFEKLRTVPVVGSFVAYPAERLRNTYNILKLGTDELREGFELGNKTLQKQGAARLANWYAAQGSMYAAAYAVNEYSGLGEGLGEKLDSIRKAFLPEYKKDNALLITGKTATGMPKFIDLSYIHPDSNFLGAITPMILKASRGEDVSKDLDSQLLESGTRLLEPYISKSLVFDAAESLKNFVTSGGDVSQLGGVVKALEPGYVKIVRDMAIDAGAFEKFGSAGYNAETFFEPRRFGEVVERGMQGTGLTKLIASKIGVDEDFADVLAKNALVYPGLKEESIDPRKAIGFALNNLKRNNQANWNEFTKDLTNALIDPSGQFDAKSIIREYANQLDSQFEGQKGLSKLLSNMEDIIPKQELYKILKSKSLRGVAPSTNDFKSFFNNRSFPIVLSTNNKFWSDINNDLILKTGKTYSNDLGELRNYFREIERFYSGRDLSKELPDIKIEE